VSVSVSTYLLIDNGIKTDGFLFCSLLNHSIMSGPSTTNYLPLDSDAPSVFSIALTNDRIFGEVHLHKLRKHGLTLTRPVAFTVRSSWMGNIIPELTYWRLIGVAAVRSHHHSGYGGVMPARLLICTATYILYYQIEWIWTFVNGT
jgi:hypothetical protein